MSLSTQNDETSALETPDPRLLMGSKDKSVLWYNSTFPGPTDVQKDLLGNYSGLKPEVITSHRDKAWDVHPLPCIGQFRFIEFSLSRSTSYPRVLESLKSGGKLLDLGCCFGQDLRKLVHDGAPATSLYGADLRSQFIDLGYDLFLDRDRIGVRFFTADIFDPNSSLKQLDGQIAVVYIGLLLRLFDWEGQRKACERIVGLLKPEKGVLVLGQQVGSLVACNVMSGEEKNVTRHDLASFEKLWTEVGEITGSQWVVRAHLDEGLGVGDGKRAWG